MIRSLIQRTIERALKLNVSNIRSANPMCFSLLAATLSLRSEGWRARSKAPKYVAMTQLVPLNPLSISTSKPICYNIDASSVLLKALG